MGSRLASARQRFHSWLSPAQQRGVRVVAWTAVVSLLGVTVTGLWQFFAHESDPSWYGYTPGRDMRIAASASEGVAELHGLFAMAVAVVALIGGAWVAYAILFDIRWQLVAALGVAFFGLVSGSIVRFNVVKLAGQDYEGASRGYLQLFGRDLEFVVGDRYELGAMAARLWTIAHVATVPVLLALVWLLFGPATHERDA